MCKFCKRLSHIHETLPFIRVNVEALIVGRILLNIRHFQATSELQIRGGVEDNIKTIFLISH